MKNSDIIQYCDAMNEIKRRADVVNAFGSGHAAALYKATSIESVYLQFQRILEMIAFGSLVANEDAFTKVFGEFSRRRNAPDLFRDLERLNPDFYPRPIVAAASQPPGAKWEWQDKPDGFLTRQDFLKLYGECAAILHAGNPYGRIIVYRYFEEDIADWLAKIMGLLNFHTIRLVNDPNLYVVHMQGEGEGKVRHSVFAPPPAPQPAT